MAKIRQWCAKHDKIIPFFIAILMLISMVPALFINIEIIKIADVDPFYITNTIFLILSFVLFLLLLKLIYPKWSFDSKKTGLPQA